MADSIQINGKTVKLIKGDITNLEVEAFVYYARHDLKLGSGFGTAIAARGGPKIQEELDNLGPLETTETVTTGGGMLKAKAIIHAVGPRFHESNMEEKLRQTMKNTLKQADEKGMKQVAFPPMGAGFYMVPLDMCARVMVETITEHLKQNTSLEEVIICVVDNREYNAFQPYLTSIKAA